MLERISPSKLSEYYRILQLLLTINSTILPTISAITAPEIAEAASDNGPVIQLTSQQLAALQEILQNTSINATEIPTDTLTTSMTASEALTSTEGSSITAPTLTSEQLAQLMGVPEARIATADEVAVTATYFATEAEYQADLATVLAHTSESQIVIIREEDGTLVEQLVPPRSMADTLQAQVATATCAVEAYIDDGTAGSATLFTEVQESFAPSGATIFKTEVTNPNAAPVTAAIESKVFDSKPTDISKRYVVLYLRTENLKPGSVGTVSIQIVHTDGHKSGYGTTLQPLTTQTGWVRYVIQMDLKPDRGEERTDKVSFYITFPEGKQQKVGLDAMTVAACPDTLLLPIIKSVDTPPEALEPYIKLGWLTFRKVSSQQSDDDFKAEIAKKYGVRLTDNGAISEVHNHWVAVNPNTLYYLVHTAEGNILHIEFTSAQEKLATLKFSEGSTSGASILGFIPFGASVNSQFITEYLAKATIEVAGQKVGGYIINVVPHVTRVGSTALTFTPFIFDSFYQSPTDQWDPLAPSTLILFHLGQRAAFVSVEAGKQNMSEFKKFLEGTHIPATYIHRSTLRLYASEELALQIENQAWYKIAKEWLIVPQSLMQEHNIPILPETATSKIISSDPNTVGSLEAVLLSESFYKPTIIPPEYAQHVTFVEQHRGRIIQALSDAFTTSGLDAHTTMSQALFQANQHILDIYKTSPMIASYDSRLDNYSSFLQLLHLSAMAEEAIRILLAQNPSETTQQTKIKEQVAVLQAHVNFLQGKIFEQRTPNGQSGIPALTTELERYQTEYHRLLSEPRNPAEEISFAFFNDDVVNGSFGTKRAEGFYTALTASLVNTVDSLLDAKVKTTDLTALPASDAQSQLIFKPALTELPADPEAVDAMNQQEAAEVWSAVNRRISTLAQNEEKLQKGIDAINESSFIKKQETKNGLVKELAAQKERVSSELARLREINNKIYDKIYGATSSFILTQYTSAFEEIYGSAATTKLTNWLTYQLIDYLTLARQQQANSNISYQHLQDYLTTTLSAWHTFLKTNQLPNDTTIRRFGKDIYMDPNITDQVGATYLGTIWRFRSAALDTTAGFFMTQSSFDLYRTSGAVNNSDVGATIKFSNGLIIYMIDAAKTNLTGLEGVLGAGGAQSNTPISLRSFVNTVTEQAKKLGAPPTEGQVQELDDDTDDAELLELLKEVNIDFETRTSQPNPVDDARKPPPPIDINFDKIREEDRCEAPLDRDLAIQLAHDFYVYLAGADELFGTTSPDFVSALIETNTFTEDGYNVVRNQRTPGVAKGIVFVYLNEIPGVTTEPTLLGAAEAVCKIQDTSDGLGVVDWQYVVFTPLSAIQNSYLEFPDYDDRVLHYIAMKKVGEYPHLYLP